MEVINVEMIKTKQSKWCEKAIPWLKCSPHKQKHWSSDPQNQYKMLARAL